MANTTEPRHIEKAANLNGIEHLTAVERIQSAYDEFGADIALLSSFGPQSIVTLSLAQAIYADIPVVMINLPGTEYDGQRLYRDYLKASLGLRLHIVNAGHQSQKKKVLAACLNTIGVRAAIDGIRWSQTENRAQKQFQETDDSFPGIVKFHPVLDWSDADIYEYIEQLPPGLRHPAYRPGIRSIGGSLLAGGQIKTECGLHV